MTSSRKLLFAVLAVVLAILVLEIGSFLLLSLRSGRLATYAVIGDERAARSAAADAPIELDAFVGPREQWIRSKSFVHPFLGFVRDPATIPEGSDPT